MVEFPSENVCIYGKKMNNKLQKLIMSANSLVTTHEQTRAGFISLALDKNRKAIPYVEEAKCLKIIASTAKKPTDLLEIKSIEQALIAASGISEKAAKYFEEKDKKEAIKAFIDNFLEPAGNNFIDELVYRFLLTKGDSLGGSMRNLIGNFGEIKLTRKLLSILLLQKKTIWWLDKKTKKWTKVVQDNADIENNTGGLCWIINDKPRTLIYNKTLSFIDGKNIDLCLVDCSHDRINEELIKPTSFLALGELKGGIDPAGADEHWKTANSALKRIHLGFSKEHLSPRLFFIGAAIAESMAKEIFSQLKTGELSYAANLTNEEQLTEICQWIIEFEI